MAQPLQTTLLTTLLPRLQELHSLYTALENDYARLPLTSRRCLYGPNLDPGSGGSLGTRTLAELKLLLAGVLQWSPSSHCYDVEKFLAEKGNVVAIPGGGQDELCPILMGWFEEMVQAERLIRDPQAAVSGWTVHELLLKAELKMEWLRMVYAVVWRRGEFARRPNEMTSLFKGSWSTQGSNEVQPPAWMVILGWNRFCYKIARGVRFDLVAAEITEPKPGGSYLSNSASSDAVNIHQGQGGRREFYMTSMPRNWQPWKAHNDSLFGDGSSIGVSPSRVMLATFGHRAVNLDDSARGPVQEQITNAGWQSYPQGYDPACAQWAD